MPTGGVQGLQGLQSLSMSCFQASVCVYVCECVCVCVYVCMCVCTVHASSTESTIVQRKKMFPPEGDEFPSVPYLVLQKALCMVDAQLK